MRRRYFEAIFVIFLLVSTDFGSCDKPTSDENGTISHTICDGNLAELSCEPGKVITIVIGNYGRFSSQVCLQNPDDYVPSNNNCQNHKTKSILEKKCNGKTACHFKVSTETFIEDPCPQTPKYLEVKYDCVVSATTTSTTTIATTTATENSLIEEGNVEEKESDRKAPLAGLVTDAMPKKESSYCKGLARRGIVWPTIKSGTMATAACPDNTNGKQTWKCDVDGLWVGEYPDTSKCENEWVSSRMGEFNEAVASEDSNGIPSLLVQLSADTRRPIVGGDLPKVLHILELIVESIVDEPWTKNVQSSTTKKVIEVVNSMIRNKEVWPSWEAPKQKEFAARIIQMAEKAMIALADNIPTASSETIVQPAITCEMTPKIKVSSQPSEYVMFPSSALWENSVVDNVNIPKKAIMNVSEDKTQVYFSSFPNIGDMMTPRDIVVPSQNPDEEPIVRKRKVVSSIVGASLVRNGKVQNVMHLVQPVRITFHHKESVVRHLSAPTCVWWNYHQLEWMPTGCKMSKHNLTTTVCECDHLTHFAVLMDVHGHQLDELDETVLTMLTYIGCGISIVCLLATFFAYLIFSKNGGDRVFIHENLCLCLAIAEITFLAGISRTDDSVQCSFIAAALLYLFLCSLCWMLLEGYHIYRMLVEVFPSEPRKYIYLPIGYLIPAVITLAAWVYKSDGFGSNKQCWLSTENYLIYFFVGPASVILLVNTFVLLKTLCIVYQHVNGGYFPCRHDVDSGRSIRTWVKGSLALGCLLGVTWSIGLLWMDDDKSVLWAYAFTILNSLQGLFIFLFHVVFSDKMRKDFNDWMNRRGCSNISSNQSSPQKRIAIPRDAMSPGMNSSTGSEFLYQSNEKYLNSLDTTNRLQYSGRMPHPNSIPAHSSHSQVYDHQPGTYDYATITYGDMLPPHMNRIVAPPAYQRLAYANPDMAARYGGSPYQSYHQTHHRPPPEFSPPPPPSASSGSRAYGAHGYGTAGSSNGRRPPSSKMSDDSAYSDGGSSSMLTTEVTPQGQTVLRIDLNKPNMYCQEL